MSKESRKANAGSLIKPRIIIHGGAGNLTKQSLPREKYNAYEKSLSEILEQAKARLSLRGSTALDVATFAVSLMEDDPLYNSGKGAVFTRAGQNELECSVMVSDGYRKRGVGCMMLKHVKNPIKLARELLIRGEETDGGGAGDHCQYSGDYVEELAKQWGLEIVDPSYFFTQQRWDEHLRGLVEERKREESGQVADKISDWERATYIPLGTCGAVVLDSFGTICTATSTGGLTNKVPGRIGDTPTIGAGFWAEEWWRQPEAPMEMLYRGHRTPKLGSTIDKVSRGDVGGMLVDCLPSLLPCNPSTNAKTVTELSRKDKPIRHAVGLSGTGNGDSFLRTSATRTASAKSRFAEVPLASVVKWMAGPGGELQRSAGDRWGRTHEGTGGIIGIELVHKSGRVVYDFNCGGMFRAWVDDDGIARFRIFRGAGWDSGPDKWPA